MEENKLISMTDFVLLDKYAGSPINMNKQYAQFLKQPLELWMFVPCDEDGNVLEEPKAEDYLHGQDSFIFHRLQRDFIKAKEVCLFEKSKYGMGTIKEIIKCSKIIEDLITCSKLDLRLTTTAIKQIGL